MKKNKYAPHEKEFGMPDALHSTTNADTHKIRRKPLASFFSKKEIASREAVIEKKVDLLCSHLDQIKGTGRVMELRLLYFCLASDILSEYALPLGINFLGQSSLVSAWRDVLIGGLRKFHYFKHFLFLWVIIKAIPHSVLLRASPDLKIRFDWEANNSKLARKIIDSYSPDTKVPDQPSVFYPLLEADLPPAERTFERLWDEARALLGAGVETMSNSLSVITFHILSNVDIRNRLQRELKNAMPDWNQLGSLNQLEKLPYLTAVITEGLRKAPGTTARFIRVTPYEDVYYQRWRLPAGTAVSMSALLQHEDAMVFPEPEKFLPDRWLGGDAEKVNLLTFSRGSRQCVGIK